MGIEEMQNSVVMATAATLRRNVRNCNFFTTLDPEERDAFVHSITADAAEAFASLGIDCAKLDGVSDMEGAVEYCDVQHTGLVPEMPLPLSEPAGFVFDRAPRGDAKHHGFLSHSLAATCGVEDHIQLRAIVEGLDPEGAWESLDRLDSALNEHVDYAFRRDIGYLTADPTRAGSALELAVYVFPIGLDIDNKAEETMREMRSRGCEFEQSGMVPGLFSGLCKVNCRTGRNRREISVARTFRRSIEELAERELESREDLEAAGRPFLVDAYARDLATLKNCRAITADEAVAKLWTVKIGLATGYVTGSPKVKIEDLLRNMRSPQFVMAFCDSPARQWDMVHNLLGADDEERDNAEDECDISRAEFLRRVLRGVNVAD